MNKHHTFLIGFAFGGLCLVGWGATSNILFLTSVGGAVFGASLGSFIGRLAKQDLAEDIKRTVREALAPGFTSDETKIDGLRKEWHLYHVTEMDRAFCWRYAKADFGKNCIPGRLEAKVSLPDKRGVLADYSLEAGMRDERLVIFIKGIGSEEPSGVYVFPFIGRKFEDRHFGVLFHQTWDGTHSISPALMTRDPLPEVASEGTADDSGASALDDIWRRGASAGSHVLPRVLTMGAGANHRLQSDWPSASLQANR